MARKYAGIGNATFGTNKTAINLIAATTTRGWLYDILLGSDATPSDIAGNFVVARTTAVGTAGSNPAPLALDPGNPAALLSLGINHSAEPTYTAGGELLQFGLNQRATFRWVSAPGGELIVPATASNGIALRSTAFSSGTPTGRSTFHWEE